MTNQQTNLKTPFSDRRGRISESKLLHFLNPNNKKREVKPVLTPTAHTKKLCLAAAALEEEFQALLLKIEKIKAQHPRLYYMIEIMINGSCRISEVLAIQWNDFKSSGQVYIKGKKGSENRLVHIFESRKFLQECKLNQVSPFEDMDRYFVYRQLKKYGIGRRFEGKEKDSITHYFRQLTLRLLQNEGVEKRDRMKQSGHKSTKSIEYYESNQAK